MKLDSASAPKMLIFESNGNEKYDCEDGIYKQEIRAVEKKTGSSAYATVLLQVKNGLIRILQADKGDLDEGSMDSSDETKDKLSRATQVSQFRKVADFWNQNIEISGRDSNDREDVSKYIRKG